MTPWDEAKQQSNLFWAARRRPAQDAHMLRAAYRAKADVQVERRNIENVPGRMLDSLRDMSPGNVLRNGAANLVDVFDFVGETARELISGEQLGPTRDQPGPGVPEGEVGPVRRPKPVPMPRVTPKRTPAQMTERRPTGTVSA